MEKGSHLWDNGIKLLIEYGADASYFTVAQKRYIHHNCVAGQGNYDTPMLMPKPEPIAAPIAIVQVAPTTSYPDWEAKIEVPYQKDPEGDWAAIKEKFSWEPYTVNLSDKSHFEEL